MELAFIILAIGVAVMMNSTSGVSKEKLIRIGKALEKDINQEFKKRDNRILELEKRIEMLEQKEEA